MFDFLTDTKLVMCWHFLLYTTALSSAVGVVGWLAGSHYAQKQGVNPIVPLSRTIGYDNANLMVRSGETIMAASNCENCRHSQKFSITCVSDEGE